MKRPSEQPHALPVDSLRRLARSLLYDSHRADDVVQEAWLAALRREREPAELGSWLAGTVRRLASNSRRGEARRIEHERRSARKEAQPGADELSARLEILRRMLDAVDRLEEPYRTTIGLRFFEELPPRMIAKRQELPVETVRTRIKRGLQQLRRELDYGASVMLLGIVQGEAREEIRRLLEDRSRRISGAMMRPQVSESNTLPASYRRADDSKSAFET